MHLPVITNSEMKTFRRCAREHRISYGRGFRPVERAEALNFGSLVHAGLEAWWKSPHTADTSWRIDAAAAAEYRRVADAAAAEYDRATDAVDACRTCDEFRAKYACPELPACAKV